MNTFLIFRQICVLYFCKRNNLVITVLVFEYGKFTLVKKASFILALSIKRNKIVVKTILIWEEILPPYENYSIFLGDRNYIVEYVYYKSKVQPREATCSTDEMFMEDVSGAKSEIYITSISSCWG